MRRWSSARPRPQRSQCGPRRGLDSNKQKIGVFSSVVNCPTLISPLCEISAVPKSLSFTTHSPPFTAGIAYLPHGSEYVAPRLGVSNTRKLESLTS